MARKGAPLIEMVGKRFGRLIVVRRDFTIRKRPDAFWMCKCDCGTVKAINGCRLRDGSTISCRCYIRAKLLEIRTTHGKRSNPMYSVWKAMIRRCSNSDDPSYKNYGGRGIQVCESWKNVETFFADMGTRPEGMTLERVDVDAGYSPENCVWASRSQQGRNRRNNRIVNVFGVRKIMSDWAREMNISVGVLRYRIESGWTISADLSMESPFRRNASR